MISKRLFADICSENRKRRLWPTALSITGCFFAQIVFAFMLLGVYEDRLREGRTVIEDIRLEYFHNVLGAGSITVLLIVFGFALINALQGFNYLFDGRMSDIYGALPVKREKLFDAFWLNGFVIFAIPYLICHIFTIILGMTRGYVTMESLPTCALSALTILIIYMLAYMTCILAAVLTGHLVVAVLAAGVFMMIGPAINYGIAFYKMVFFMSYVGDDSSSLSNYLSPLSVATRIAIEYFSEDSVTYPVKAIYPVGFALVVSIILFVLCRSLIKIRPSESAGKAISFAAIKPFIKCVITVVAAMYSGLVFFTINDRIGGLIFGVIAGLILTHAVMETIFEFDFKASFRHFGSLFLSSAIACGILLFFIFDPLHFDTYLPRADRVESLALSDNVAYEAMNSIIPDDEIVYGPSAYQSRNMKLTDMTYADPLATEGAKYVQAHRLERIFDRNHSYDYGYEDENGNYVNMTFRWTLKGGKTVSRIYYVNLDDAEALSNFSKIFDSREYKEGTFGILKANASDFNSISWQDLSGNHTVSLDEAERKELIAAISQDIMDQTFEELMNEKAVNSYELIGDWGRTHNNIVYNFFLFPSFDRTMEFLSKKEIGTSWKVGEDKVNKLELSLYGDNDYYGYWESVNSEEIQTVLDNISITDLDYVNSRIRTDRDDAGVNVDGYLTISNKADFSVQINTTADLPEDLLKEIKRSYDLDDSDLSLSDAGWVTMVKN